jgi:hypothetical protein
MGKSYHASHNLTNPLAKIKTRTEFNRYGFLIINPGGPNSLPSKLCFDWGHPCLKFFLNGWRGQFALILINNYGKSGLSASQPINKRAAPAKSGHGSFKINPGSLPWFSLLFLNETMTTAGTVIE